MSASIPIIDISKIVSSTEENELKKVAFEIREACVNYGFFYIEGHGVSEVLHLKIRQLSEQFFNLDLDEKMKIEMRKGGKAWRGYFSLGDELTSGKPDLKEGIYFGNEQDDNHPRVLSKMPLHGKNLFASKPDSFKEIVLEYMDEVTKVGHVLLQAISLSLGKDKHFFSNNYTANPLILFRIFHYPPTKEHGNWGVGEHTDYGLLTILMQDEVGGLQVKSKGVWIDALPLSNTFVCNIGDMLELITNGLYISTPHRVKNNSEKSRFSFPLFFDPDVMAEIKKIESLEVNNSKQKRWDGADIMQYSGTYGDYLLNKIKKVFPDLEKDVL